MYKVENNKIIITNTADFNTTHILECGQVFRFKKIAEDTYIIFSLDKVAKIVTYQDLIEIETTDVDYFVNYFDLDTDYGKIKQDLSKFEILKEPIKYGYGIRILKQDLFEMIISFIISANNNIKRIQGIIEKICEFCGTKIGDFYAFPTLEQLTKCTVQDFKRFGAGYRAEYLHKVCRQLQEVDLEKIAKIPSCDARKMLCSLMGVGPKVADCILLFGLNRQDVFPVDTWIMKVYTDMFGGTLTNRQQIANYLVNYFGSNMSGYAQQYLFYYKREE